MEERLFIFESMAEPAARPKNWMWRREEWLSCLSRPAPPQFTGLWGGPNFQMCATSSEPDNGVTAGPLFGRRTRTDDEVFGPGEAVVVPPGVTFEAEADDDHWDKLKGYCKKIRGLAESVKAHLGDVPPMDPMKAALVMRQEVSRLPGQFSNPADLAAALRGPPPPAGAAMGEIRGHAFDAVYQLLTMAADIAQETLAKRHAGNGAPPPAEPPPPGAPNPETT